MKQLKNKAQAIENCKKQTRKTNYKEAGITLVALVVTIIVLLILAGIAISLALGENGILQRATYAKKITDEAQLKEKINLAYSSALAEDLGKGNSNFQKNTLESVLAEEFPESTISVIEDLNDSTKWVVTVDGVSVTVPAGTAIATDEDQEERAVKVMIRFSNVNGDWTDRGEFYVGVDVDFSSFRHAVDIYLMSIGKADGYKYYAYIDSNETQKVPRDLNYDNCPEVLYLDCTDPNFEGGGVYY